MEERNARKEILDMIKFAKGKGYRFVGIDAGVDVEFLMKYVEDTGDEDILDYFDPDNVEYENGREYAVFQSDNISRIEKAFDFTYLPQKKNKTITGLIIFSSSDADDEVYANREIGPNGYEAWILNEE